jgi:Flp pilus assembly protein TadG
MHSLRERLKSRRGNAIIEFALCVTFLLPLAIGSMSIGIDLSHSMQASQVVRDAGHMYARSTDFSQTSMKNVIVKVASGLNMTTNGGDGVVIFSTIMRIGTPQCTAGGLNTSTCTNRNKYVVTHRVTIGNTSFGTSRYATPAANIVQSDGDIAANNYLTNNTVVDEDFGNQLTLADGEVAYVVESYFKSLNFLKPASETHRIYSVALF